MKVLGFILLATVALASMETLETSPFGKALSETIQLQLKLENGMQSVIDLIWDLDASI
jgi:hypothetical protein